jgi:hypothetical protein
VLAQDRFIDQWAIGLRPAPDLDAGHRLEVVRDGLPDVEVRYFSLQDLPASSLKTARGRSP